MTHETSVAAIPADLGNNAKPVRLRFMIGGALLLAFVAFLGAQIFMATTSTGAYYLTVSEVNGSAAQMVDQRIRVSGAVVPGSEDWNPQEITLRFKIQDDKGQQLPIVFFGPRPDNFQRAAEAIIEGRLGSGGEFQADTLLLKCPSRYEEDPEQVFVKSTH